MPVFPFCFEMKSPAAAAGVACSRLVNASAQMRIFLAQSKKLPMDGKLLEVHGAHEAFKAGVHRLAL